MGCFVRLTPTHPQNLLLFWKEEQVSPGEAPADRPVGLDGPSALAGHSASLAVAMGLLRLLRAALRANGHW